MQKLSKTKLISLLSKLLVLLLIAKIIALGVWWYLPSEGVELNAKKSYLFKYQRVSFSNMLLKEEAQSRASQSISGTTSTAASINTLILKGLYGTRFEGFAIIAKKSSQKDTTIVAVGESYEGYKLIEIAAEEVIFTKNGAEYRLALLQSDAKYSQAVQKVQKDSPQESKQKEVARADIKTYSDNPALIWKDIGIQELKEGKNLKGFVVTRVRKGSKMATLGLQKDDIIIKANNIAFTSLNDVFQLYKDINKIDVLALTIKRNNQEKEIIYEIR